ncbi:hypothetical protein LLG46_00750 [bacterium]|nr:hypothetical protein [bacterium]
MEWETKGSEEEIVEAVRNEVKHAAVAKNNMNSSAHIILQSSADTIFSPLGVTTAFRHDCVITASQIRV